MEPQRTQRGIAAAKRNHPLPPLPEAVKKLGCGEKLQFTHEPFSQKILSNRPLTLPLSPESGGEGGGEGDFFTASPLRGGGLGWGAKDTGGEVL